MLDNGAEIEMVVNGAVSNVAVSATMKIRFTGNSPIEVPIIIGANAGGTELTASVPVSVVTDADANIVLNEGAEGSKVKINLKSLLVQLTNSTGKPVEATNVDGVKTSVPSTGKKTTIPSTTPSTSGSSYPGSSSGSYYPGSSSGSGSSGTTVKHTLPTFTVKASIRVETTTQGSLLLDENDIKIQGCVNPKITNMQWSGHNGEYKSDLKKDGSIWLLDNYGIGSDDLEEIIDKGMGAWIFITVQDQETEYVGVVPMNFGKIIQAGYEQTFEGVMTKKSDITFSKLISQVQSGISRDGKFLYMTFQFTDNGKKYTADVSTSYRDFFGDDPEHFADGSHSYSAVLYETE